MDPRFPTLLPQRQIDSRITALAPSLPWGEWLIVVGLMFLAAL